MRGKFESYLQKIGGPVSPLYLLIVPLLLVPTSSISSSNPAKASVPLNNNKINVNNIIGHFQS